MIKSLVLSKIAHPSKPVRFFISIAYTEPVPKSKFKKLEKLEVDITRQIGFITSTNDEIRRAKVI